MYVCVCRLLGEPRRLNTTVYPSVAISSHGGDLGHRLYGLPLELHTQARACAR